MDATKATEAVTGYFKSIGSPFGFAVESARRRPNEDTWTIICSVWDYMGATVRSRYEVLVDPAGSVSQVTRLDA